MKRHKTSIFGTILPAFLLAASAALTGCLAETADPADGVETAESALTGDEPTSPDKVQPPQVVGAPFGRPGADRATDPQPDPWTGSFTGSARDPQPDPWQPKTVKTT